MMGPSSLRCVVLPSPLGRLYAAFSERGLVRLSFGRSVKEAAFVKELRLPARRIEADDDECTRQLAEELVSYFDGIPEPFRTKLDLRAGTPFQRRVWRALRRIPFGKTQSYSDVARRVGVPRGARAVGQAVGANPVPIIIPCHRVIRTSGELGGFGAGLPIKRWLLRHEQPEDRHPAGRAGSPASP